MAEIKALKQGLVQDVRDGKLTPQEAVDKFNTLTPNQIKTGRVYEQKDAEARKQQYVLAKRVRDEIKRCRVPFISSSFLPSFWLSQGLIVVGAESGKAKSTTCSNVLHGFLGASDRSAIVISNEEATDAVYERTACVALKKDYTQFFQGKLTEREEQEIQDFVINHIIPRTEVIEDGAYDMAYLEDVQSVLESAACNKVGIVLIDYLQVITQSRNNPSWEAFQVSKALGLYLKEYGKKHGVPVVCFAQLHSTTRGPTMAERVQNDKTFYNHGFACIEVVPDFETLTTKFKVHKDRFFGHTGKEVIVDFKGGRYVFANEDSL